jgi:hypothetical protein
MSAPSDAIPGLRDLAEGILCQGRFQNFVAQTHSRDVLRQLRVPPDEGCGRSMPHVYAAFLRLLLTER